MIPEPAARREDIDWLRIGATFLLFVFHPARPFDHEPWHVKSVDRSDAFDLLVWFIHQFHMPLFFVLAGWSLERSLRRRAPDVVRRERTLRLLVPSLAGVIMLSPAQAYVEAVTQHGYMGTVARFLRCFFTSLTCFSWHHLWFLIYLFTFSLLYIPLLTRLPRTAARPVIGVRHVVLAVVPLAAVQVGLRWRWPGLQNLYDDWANFLWYSLFFVGGFLIARVPEVEDVIRRGRWRWSAGFIATVLAMLPILATRRDQLFLPGGPYVAYWSLSAAAGVFGVSALLGWGRLLPPNGGPRFRYLRQSLLPVYVLHQAVIVVLAYWFVRLPVPIGVRYLVLAAASLAATMLVYELAVRRIAALRVLFGMTR